MQIIQNGNITIIKQVNFKVKKPKIIIINS